MDVFSTVITVAALFSTVLQTYKYAVRHERKDIENYLNLAREVDLCPEIGIFRRFGEINNFSLLYMQAEIASLEREFLSQRELDGQTHCPITRSYNFSMDQLRCSKGEDGAKQRDLLVDIQAKLKLYSETSHSVN